MKFDFIIIQTYVLCPCFDTFKVHIIIDKRINVLKPKCNMLTRTKTSIRYAKQNDREKREKERLKERYREGGRDKRKRERKRETERERK